MGTKLRALYQRRKARDLFDLHVALQERVLDVNRVIGAFLRYMAYGGHSVSRDAFEKNIAEKLRHPQFNADIGPLLATGYTWNYKEAAENVCSQLISRLTG